MSEVATAEYVMAEADAERLTRRITLMAGTLREGMEKLHGLVAEAKAGNAHVALGYASWTAYLAATLGKEPLRLGREERQQLVGYLAGEGMSTRAIAPIVGVSVGQAHADRVAGVQSLNTSAPAAPPVILATVDLTTGEIHEAAAITGLDGKTYGRPAPLAAAPRHPQRDDAETYLNLAQSYADRAAREIQKLTPAQIERVKPNAAHWVSGIGESVETFQRLLTSLTEEKK